MPTYYYECSKCGDKFERQQKMTDEPLKKCPCGGELYRVVSGGTGFILKGQGWPGKDIKGKQ